MSSITPAPGPEVKSLADRRRILRVVLAGEIISMTGSQLSAVAMPWFVLKATGSASDMGRVMAAQMAAVVVFGLAGASLAGRLGPRRVMLTGDFVRAPLVALVPLLHRMHALPLPLFMVLLFAIGAFYAPYAASQQVLLPHLAGDDLTLLSVANARLQGATRLTVLLGPPASGLLIVWLDAPTVLLLDAASYLVSATLLRYGLPRGIAAPELAARPRLREGLRVIVRDRLLAFWSFGQIFGETAWQALFVLLPVLALRYYGGSSALAGLLLGSFGGGALTGTLLVGQALRRTSPARLAVFGRVGQCVAFAALLFHIGAAGLAAILVVAGICNGLSNAPTAAVRITRIPPALRSTVLTTFAAAGLAGGTIGLVAAGSAVQHLGPGRVFDGLAVLQALACLTFVAGLLWGRREPVPDPASEADGPPLKTESDVH